jgi:hypothetical protein
VANPRSRTTGIKVLISAAAIGATLSGWAVIGNAARQAQLQPQTQGQSSAPVPVVQQAAPLPTRTAPSNGTQTGPRVVTAPPRVVQPPPLVVTRSSR